MNQHRLERIEQDVRDIKALLFERFGVSAPVLEDSFEKAKAAAEIWKQRRDDAIAAEKRNRSARGVPDDGDAWTAEDEIESMMEL